MSVKSIEQRVCDADGMIRTQTSFWYKSGKIHIVCTGVQKPGSTRLIAGSWCEYWEDGEEKRAFEFKNNKLLHSRANLLHKQK